MLPVARPESHVIDFPTLFVAADWTQAHCIVPDGFAKGDLFELVDWQLWALLNFYRLKPDAKVGQLASAFHFRRSQLVGSQKTGKAPYTAAHVCVEAVGPALFAGWAEGGEQWDCRDHGCPCGWAYEYRPGEAMGMAWATPLIQITAYSEDQPLALDTEVATPAGWATVGELQVGDEVFDAHGVPVEVRRTTPVLFGEECFRVVFSDGEAIVASANHGWTVERKSLHDGRYQLTTISTKEMGRTCADAHRGKRCRVEGAALELPARPLEVDPYLLGLWLGDGSTADATIAVDTRDRDELGKILRPLLRWFEDPVWHQDRGHSGSVRIRKRKHVCARGHDWSEDRVPHGTGEFCGPCLRTGRRPRPPRLYTLRERLRQVGVLGNKHIPDAYLRAGTTQRRSLLQGLIDSDGHVSEKGRVMFTNINERLICDVGELVTSLGYPWTVRKTANAWRLFFTPFDGQPVARLPRKQISSTSTHHTTGRYRYVERVERVPSVPVRCIGLDTEDHLFLAGRRCVPTHNTDNIYDSLRPMIDEGPLHEVIPKTGEEFIRLPNKGRIDVVTSNAQSRLGQRVTFVPQDEVGIWTQTNGMVKVAETQRRGLAGMGGRAEETTNAWDPAEGSVAQRTAESKQSDIFRWHPLPPASLSYKNKAERRKIHRIVYHGCKWVDLDNIEAEAAELLETDPAQAERFFGNRPVAGEDKAFDVEIYASLAKLGEGIEAGRRVTAGFDGSRTDDETALVVTDIETGHQILFGRWAKPNVRDDDWEVNTEDVYAAMEEMFDRWDVWRLYADPAYWRHELNEWAGFYGENQIVKWDTNRVKEMAYAIRGWKMAMRPGVMSHDGDEHLVEQVGNAVRQRTRTRDEDGLFLWRIQKEAHKSPLKIDAAMAAILSWEARSDALREPPEEEPVYARAQW